MWSCICNQISLALLTGRKYFFNPVCNSSSSSRGRRRRERRRRREVDSVQTKYISSHGEYASSLSEKERERKYTRWLLPQVQLNATVNLFILNKYLIVRVRKKRKKKVKFVHHSHEERKREKWTFIDLTTCANLPAVLFLEWLEHRELCVYGSSSSSNNDTLATVNISLCVCVCWAFRWRGEERKKEKEKNEGRWTQVEE